MLRTTEDMYKECIAGINKHRTSTLTPEKFNDLFNRMQLEFVRERGKEAEKTQKRFDDMRVVHVDAVVSANGPTSFPIPDGVVVVDINGNVLPEYLQLLGIDVKITYVNNACGLTGISDWIGNIVVDRADNRIVNRRNPFRKPADDRIYYKMSGSNFVIETGTSSTAYQARIEYYKYPPDVFYNKANPPDTGNPATGSVNCILPPMQRSEICDMVVRKYLEKSTDIRYKTTLQEDIISNQSK